jgi:glycosyltransferase involved in cell wall biosynthesis
MSKVKILYIYHSSAIGGGSYCLYNIVQKLDKERFEPIVLLKEEGPLCKMLNDVGANVIFEKTISIVPYNSSLFNVTSIKSLFGIAHCYFRLRSILIETSPDILYVNTMMMYPFLRIAKKLSIKTIIHIREHWPNNEHRFQLKLAKKNIEKYADKIIAINKTSASIVCAPEKTVIIYDWIDFGKRENAYVLESIFGEFYRSYRIFLFTGGIESIKGTKEVVRIFSSQILDPNARLLIMGANTELNYLGFRGKIAKFLLFFNYDTYANSVKKMIREDKRIVCRNSTYQLKQLIEEAFCVLSYFTVPHANLILAESVCLGQIVIAASTPEALEYSNGGNSACLFEMNNGSDFVEKINDVIRDRNKYKRKAIDGMAVNNFLFNPVRNSILLNEVYNSVLK